MINEIIKKLLDWQRTHRVLIEIVYVPTAQNHADLPSREIMHEELSITNRFLRFESLKIVKSVLTRMILGLSKKSVDSKLP